MISSSIRENVKKILSELPPTVQLQAACKKRTAEEIQEAVDAGISLLGGNYVAESISQAHRVNGDCRWHLIGHLQKNKVNKALGLFHLIESLDSVELARKINARAERLSKKVECLIEVNSASESGKTGVFPEDLISFAESVSQMPFICIRGLMTMGPLVEDPEIIRPFFRKTKNLFDEISSLKIPDIEMNILSMGMSSSYRIAVEEGATLIRVGTAIFGPRD